MKKGVLKCVEEGVFRSVFQLICSIFGAGLCNLQLVSWLFSRGISAGFGAVFQVDLGAV